MDGAPIDLLLATGSSEVLTEAGRAALGPGPARRGMSVISEEVYARWRARHPEWRVVEGAVDEGDNPIIEVPALSVGGFTVGPVWFAASYSGGTYSRWFRQFTDRPLEGALGGNALRFFRVTIDFPGAQALFERP